MADLAIERMRDGATWKHKLFTLTVGYIAYKGHGAALVRATGKVVPFDNAPGLIFLGIFDETVDATSAAKLVNVDLLREVVLEWFENDTVAPVLATTGILGPCYMLDNHTVTADPEAGSGSGLLVWAVDTIRGVAVERVAPFPTGDQVLSAGPALTAFSSGATAPASIVSGAVYDVPTTAATSTIDLPAASPDGTWCIFVADGVKNGHTVQYRDVSTAITTALTASTRHQVRAQMSGGKWFALAYVSP